MALSKVSPDPIWNIQRSVYPQREEVMRGDGFCFPCPLQQEQLRQDRNTLQPDTERPENLTEGVFIRVDKRKDQRPSKEVLYSESIEIRIMGWFVGGGHKVQSVAGRDNEENLENGIISAIGESPEEIEISGNVDNEVKGLRFE